MLVTGKELLIKAQEGGYAVGAFNVNNMEIVQAIIEAAELEKSPVILQASQGGIKYAGIEFVAEMAKLAARNASVPVAIHLDHGTDFDQIMLCIRHGFTSVMIDGSKYVLDENIAITKKVVEVAHAVGVSVEAELGKIGGVEDHIKVDERDATFTDPNEAKIFVDSTGVDSLAIAIGTAHGQYKGEPKLDYDRLTAIRGLVDIPLVLHGASGVPDEAIVEAIKRGVSKINIDTDIRLAFTRGIKAVLEARPNEFDPRKLLGKAKDEMRDIVRTKIRLFGGSGRA